MTCSPRLAGKTAIITGGANGIGRAVALRFLAEGANVLVADVNADSARAVLEQAASAGRGDRIRFARADVSSERDVESAFARACDEFGGLHVVVNSAGIGGAFGPVTELSAEDWDRTFAVLVRGVFLGMKHGARILAAQGEGGAIITMASVAGIGAGAGASCYSAAKAAVINLTQSIAVELAPHRIRVNAVAPGVVMTELYHRGNPSAAERTALAHQPWPRVGLPDDVAGVVAFLASSDAELITGETLVVDGGLLARGPALFGSGSANVFLKAAGIDHGTSGVDQLIRKRMDSSTG